MRWIRGFWNHEQFWVSRQKRQRDLARRSAVRLCDPVQYLAALAVWLRKVIMAERRISNHRDGVLLAPGNHGMLDRALLQVIEPLVAGNLAFACHCQHLVEVTGVKIADPPAANFARVDQLLECRDGLRQRI